IVRRYTNQPLSVSASLCVSSVLTCLQLHLAPQRSTGPRCRSSLRLACLLPTYDLPCGANVVLGRPRVADSEPEDVPPGKPRPREERLPAPVDPLEQRLVLLVRGVEPEADGRERVGRRNLPAGLGLDPRGEEAGEPDVLADCRLQSCAPVAAEHRPQLERPEAAAERGPVVAEVERDVLARLEDVLPPAEGALQVRRAPRPEQRAVH